MTNLLQVWADDTRSKSDSNNRLLGFFTEFLIGRGICKSIVSDEDIFRGLRGYHSRLTERECGRRRDGPRAFSSAVSSVVLAIGPALGRPAPSDWSASSDQCSIALLLSMATFRGFLSHDLIWF